MNLKTWVPCVLALMACTQHAFAGRPLASDDAGTAGAGTCQLESWVEHAGSNRSLIAAPACGVAQGMELGVDYALPHPRNVLRATGGLALKWVPESWRAETRAGALNFGLKLSASFKRPAS